MNSKQLTGKVLSISPYLRMSLWSCKCSHGYTEESLSTNKNGKWYLFATRLVFFFQHILYFPLFFSTRLTFFPFFNSSYTFSFPFRVVLEELAVWRDSRTGTM